MRVFVVSVILLGALGFGIYQCKPARTHVTRVLIGPAEEEDEPLVQAAQEPAAEVQAEDDGGTSGDPES